MKIYFKILGEIIKKNKGQTLLCVLFMVLMSVLQVFIPISMKEMIARIEVEGTVKMLCLCVGIYALMWMVYNVINVKWYKQIDILGEKVICYIRKNLFDVIWICEYSKFQKFSKDYLKNVFFTDVISIYGNIILYSLNGVADLLMLVVLLAVSLYIDVATTVILMIMVGGGLLLSLLTKPVMAECSVKVNRGLKQDNAVSNEAIELTELIRTNGLYDYYEKKIKGSIHNFIRIAIDTDQKSIFLQNLMKVYHQVALLVITGFLVVGDNAVGTGGMVYYIFVSNLVIEKSQSIEDNIYRFIKNLAAFENVDEIVRLGVSRQETTKSMPAIADIEFEGVGLSYPSVGKVFEGLSFRLEKGDAVLIQGRNGCGKSTVLKMIAGLVSPSEGEIKYNGQVLSMTDRQGLYGQICYLSQEELLLNESLKDYVSIVSHKDITDEKYEELRQRVGLYKEYGVLNDNGRSFSGGEKKKAILMKLLARMDEVSVVLFDETEGGLDEGSKAVMDSIENELIQNKGKYIVVRISHEMKEDITKYNKIIKMSLG